ncbi:hypothetical protein [Shewanella polaris]|uniref:Uncharacterized protein n=1 Tax=Shewanella polaris TaxID=2588449 RepID=A0A4Y5YFH8_9GAMM|nr:hypothetical protein [Shewanella polaris]QDE31435.1 hypothetical protein FH971_10955 [Shewanella polaris]
MLNLEDISSDPIKIRQHKRRFHYLQFLYLFLVFSVGITEMVFFFSPLPGCVAVTIAYLFRYINKPIFPAKAWKILKVTIFCLMAASLGFTNV